MTAHPLTFDESTVYFTFSFSATTTINTTQVANKLLKAGLAESVSSTTSDEVRVSPRFGELSRLIRQTDRLGHASDEYGAPETNMLLWVTKHPRISLPVLSRQLWYKATRRQRPARPEASDSDSQPLSEKMAELGTHIKHSVSYAQATNAFIHAIEKDLFRPSYLDASPYVRLNLRYTGQWFTRKSDGTTRARDDWDEGIKVDAMLLIHPSGVMQLTFAIKLPDHLSTDEFIAMSRGDYDGLVASEMPENLLRLDVGKKSDESTWLGAWNDEVREGERWRRIWYEEPSSMAVLLEIYSHAIERAAGITTSGGWICYPTLFIDQTSCCLSKSAWLANHPRDLARVTARMRNNELRDDLVDRFIPDDSSITRDSSFYTTVGMATVINWADKIPTFDGHLHRFLLVEACLRQYWQLVVLHSRIGETIEGRHPDLRRVQVETLNGMQEWRQSALTYGTAMEISDKLLRELSVPLLHTRLNQSLNQLQQIQAADDSRRASSRVTALAIATVVATVVLGLPAIDAALDVIRKTKSHSFAGWLASPLRTAARHGSSGSWTVYLILVAVVLVISLWAIFFPRPYTLRSQRGSRRAPGMRWPWGTIEIVMGSPDDEPDETRLPRSEFGV